MDLSVVRCRTSFDTRRLADNVETRVVLTEIPPEHEQFIESRDMFFLSTIDHQGRPTVSYKGGDPGFVRVLDSRDRRFSLLRRQRHVLLDGNLLGTGESACCSSTSRSRTGCACRAMPAVDDNRVPLLQDTPKRSWSCGLR